MLSSKFYYPATSFINADFKMGCVLMNITARNGLEHEWVSKANLLWDKEGECKTLKSM